MAGTAASQRRRRRPAEDGSDAQVAWLAGVLAVGTAAVTVGLFVRLSDDAAWAPFVGWLLAGAVAGVILRNRMAAIQVAILSTVGAGLATGVVAYLTRPPATAVKHPAQLPAPTAGEVMVMTIVCSLAAVLGAAGVAEYYRWRDAKR